MNATNPMKSIMNPRKHTFYMKNLKSSHPLKRLYKHSHNLSSEDIQNFYKWKYERDVYSDGYPTNIHIIFD